MPPPHHAVGIQTVPVQHVHAAVAVDSLRLLVHEPGALGYREGHDAGRARQDTLAARKVRDDHGIAAASGSGVPARAAVRGPRVADVAVVGRGVGPRLRLVLRVQRVVPAVVGHELAVHPRRVEVAAVGGHVEAVDVGVVGYAFEVRAEELVGSCLWCGPLGAIRVIWRRRVHAEMVVAESGFAGAEGE